MVRRASGAALTAVTLALLAGCGSGAAPRATSSARVPARSTSASTSTLTPAPTASVSRTVPATASSSAAVLSSSASGMSYAAPKECLLRASQVEGVLGGRWSRKDSGSGSCVYTSDRQAIFAIAPVPTAPGGLRAALADARVNNCDTPPRNVPGTDGGFVCIERSADKDTVEGNIVARGHFWLFVIVGSGDDRDHPAERKAVVALLAAVPR